MIGLHLDLGRIRAYGSAYLASILYQNENGDFIYTLDSSSNTILDNQSMGGEAYDGLPYSGRGIELGALNDTSFDVPTGYFITVYDFATSSFIQYDDTGTVV